MNINIYKSPQMCLYYESNTNSCWIPAGILPESTESGHSCRIPGFLPDSAGIPPEFLDSGRIPRIPAGISGGLKSAVFVNRDENVKGGKHGNVQGNSAPKVSNSRQWAETL